MRHEIEIMEGLVATTQFSLQSATKDVQEILRFKFRKNKIIFMKAN